MQVWEHCFHHGVQSQVLQLQFHVIFRLGGHELSLDLALRGDNSFPGSSLTKCVSLQVVLFHNVPRVQNYQGVWLTMLQVTVSHS